MTSDLCCCVPQLAVQATRAFQTGIKTAVADVEVNVRRNDNPPIFTREIYSAVISEYSILGSSVIQLLASDADAQVRTVTSTWQAAKDREVHLAGS